MIDLASTVFIISIMSLCILFRMPERIYNGFVKTPPERKQLSPAKEAAALQLSKEHRADRGLFAAMKAVNEKDPYGSENARDLSEHQKLILSSYWRPGFSEFTNEFFVYALSDIKCYSAKPSIVCEIMDDCLRHSNNLDCQLCAYYCLHEDVNFDELTNESGPNIPKLNALVSEYLTQFPTPRISNTSYLAINYKDLSKYDEDHQQSIANEQFVLGLLTEEDASDNTIKLALTAIVTSDELAIYQTAQSLSVQQAERVASYWHVKLDGATKERFVQVLKQHACPPTENSRLCEIADDGVRASDRPDIQLISLDMLLSGLDESDVKNQNGTINESLLKTLVKNYLVSHPQITYSSTPEELSRGWQNYTPRKSGRIRIRIRL